MSARTLSNEDYAWAFTRQVRAALKTGHSLPALGEGIPIEETRRIMMRVYSILGGQQWRLREVNRLSEELPKVAMVTRPNLREVLYGILLRPEPGALGAITWNDYDTLTLPWRCLIGPVHPEDDNDVSPDVFVEWTARDLQRQHPGLDRHAARTQAYLMKPG
jgi:hypothetical protein